MSEVNSSVRKRDEYIAAYEAGKITLVDLCNRMYDLGYVDCLMRKQQQMSNK